MKKSLMFGTFAVFTALLAGAWSQAGAAVVGPNGCSPLFKKKVLVLPGNGHDEPRNATLTNLKAFATQVGFTIKADGNPLALTDASLAEYDVIVFNYFFNTHNPNYFPQASKDAFMRWLKKGNKGYVGYHTSGANEWATNEWRSYQDSVTGMRYALHGSGTPSGTVEATKDEAILSHPIMKDLPQKFTGNDEWYNYLTDSKIFSPAWNWKIMYWLTTLPGDVARSPGPPNHPAAWFREDETGTRFFYSIFVHTQDGANSDFFKSVLLRALEYTAGPENCDDPNPKFPVSVLEGPSMQGGLSYLTGKRELRVELEGDYHLSVWSPEGKKLYSAKGSGRKAYSPEPFGKPGLYVVKIESKTRSLSRKIMVY